MNHVARPTLAISLNQATMRTIEWTDESQQRRILSAGSGLVRLGASFWIAGDDLHHLIELPVAGEQPGVGHRVFPGDLPDDKAARKKLKPDTEALFAVEWRNQNLLIAFPSGSKPNRTRGAMLTLDQKNQVMSTEEVDFSKLIQALKLRIPNLNIEGATVWQDKLVLFQRGNGKAGVNALIELDLEMLMSKISQVPDSEILGIHHIELPEMNGVRLTFTDCEVAEGTLYFSAAAEGGEDTYLDAEIVGSAIGRLRQNLQPEILGTVEKLKIEGLAFCQTRGCDAEFQFITDTDDPEKPSQTFTGIVDKGSDS